MLVELLIPIAICVILPVTVVWIAARTKINADNKRAEVLTEAIRSNNGVYADKLADALTKKSRSPREILNLRLLRGCIFTLIGVTLSASPYMFGLFDLFAGPQTVGLIFVAIGISYLIVYFVTRHQVSEE